MVQIILGPLCTSVTVAGLLNDVAVKIEGISFCKLENYVAIIVCALGNA